MEIADFGNKCRELVWESCEKIDAVKIPAFDSVEFSGRNTSLHNVTVVIPFARKNPEI